MKQLIENILKEYREYIDKKIDILFPVISADYKAVADAARYSLLLGGKRIRPAIVLEFAKLCGGDVEDAINFAVALEMIHTYSLIHDDLPCMDNDDMRRGKPSCHKAFGEDTALLAGDTLLTAAFSVAAKANLPDDRKVAAISCLSDRAGLHGMIGGQVLDLDFEINKPTIEQLTEMCLKKTGALLSAAAELGCIAAGADEKTKETARSYALKVGLAFQIIDDILDVTGDAALLGKPIGSDAENEKTTFVTLLGLEKAKELADELTKEAIELLAELSGDTSVLCELTSFLLERNY